MSAPNLKEIEWAISDLENQESSEKRYILLAALYTCRDHMLTQLEPQPAAYAETAAPAAELLSQYGNSDFLRSVARIPACEAWLVMDELMEVLQTVNPRVYDSVMRRLNRI